MGSRDRLTQAWRNLHSTFSKLAGVTLSVKEEKMTFVLMTGECIHAGWIPFPLPGFHRLGESRVEYERTRVKSDSSPGQGASTDGYALDLLIGYSALRGTKTYMVEPNTKHL